MAPRRGKIRVVDAIDRKILALVQFEGRLTVTELAVRIGLSVSPCHRRLRELERSGAISGYRAIVDPEAVGLRFQALVFVTMRQEDRETLLGFERAITEVSQVVQTQGFLATPTTCCASSPRTSARTSDSKTRCSQHCPEYSD